MDSFFEYDFNWDDLEFPTFNDPLPVIQSSFVPYKNQFLQRSGGEIMTPEKKSMNVKNRMVEFLKKNWTPVPKDAIESEKERNRKHMINERTRREKEKQNYDNLRKLLPRDTKRDKKSIVQMASREIEKLKSYKAKMQKKNKELENVVKSEEEEARSKASMEVAKIKIRVSNPSSGIDSMLELLKCLKTNGCIATSIHSNFSAMEFSSLLQIKTSIKAADVERTVERTLFEVEKKFRCPNTDMDNYTSTPMIK